MDWKKTDLAELESPNLLQSGFWGAFKACFGWDALAMQSSHGSSVLVLYRRLAGGSYLAYIPHPFYKASPDYRLICDLSSACEALSPYNIIFTRIDIGWEKHPDSTSPAGFIKSPVDIQPPDTVILDLNYSEEELLSAMHKKTRYNIRLAKKKGVRIAVLPYEQYFDAWYELYLETAKRDKISIHSKEYYKKLFWLAENWEGLTPSLFLLGAFYGNKLLAGNIVSFYGDTATYLYGASSNEHRNIMPTYLLQWETIKMAREAGLKHYDLYGIPPAPDPSHPMYGLYRFKTGFGGKTVKRAGCWDIPLNKAAYSFYRLAENIRQTYHKRIKKMFRR
ncbi:peptidoglycan bridge formation glycyltransferase FemA/FemB family protein [Spirochaetia bacterium 38H-sp]|uniref:Peptidoglycan bridge formation glycyltransferase FemA/FemB family protein n=1 Tax=Rarispira pelagica TaxID=3141764 RepID=A0ABU9UAF4_9SPIR